MPSSAPAPGDQGSSRAGLVGRLTAPVRRVEYLVWFLCAAAVLAWRLAALGGPSLENDSYQYLSVASNFAHGHPACTSIVHFDSERSHRTLPAPMTTFPPGYPAVVAAASAAGLKPEAAAAAASAAALLLLVGLYAAAGPGLGLDGLGTRLLLLGTFANAQLLTFGTFVLTEALFTLLATAAVVLLARGVAGDPDREGAWGPLLAANLFIGLAYWVRYAGLFLFASAGVLVLYLALARRPRAALRAGLAMLVSAAIIGLGLLRNVLLVGDWKGGNEKVVHHGLGGVLVDFVSALVRLVSGNGFSARLLPLDLLVGLGVALAAGLAWSRREARTAPVPGRRALAEVGLCFLLVYCAALVRLGQTSVITFGVRMFVPILPTALLLLAALVARAQERLPGPRRARFAAGAALAAGAYLALNVHGLLAQPAAPAPDRMVQAALRQPTPQGQTLDAWLAANLAPDEVVVATQGQALAYHLRRPAVSLVSLSYSRQRWDEAAVQAVMRDYRARYLVLFATDHPELFQSPFLEGLQAGVAPAWLAPAAGAGPVRIYRRIP